LTYMHETLSAADAGVLDDPRNQAEGLDRATCGPHLKHLSELAAAAATEGFPAAQWRADLLTEAGLSAVTALNMAERCMRKSGLG
jgi:hypothetical protein